MILLIGTVLVLNGFAIMMPKRIPRWEFYVTSWFALFFELIVNVYLDLKYDLYGYFDKGVNWGTLIAIFGLYPAGNAIILNFYPYKKRWLRKAFYVMFIDVICTLYEFLATHSTFFYYNGWEWWYSFLAYPLIIQMLVWNLNIIRRLINPEHCNLPPKKSHN